MSFDTYDELAHHPDCKYAFDVNQILSMLTRRVESLNLVGGMLWPEPFPEKGTLPISRYEWLIVTADVFLMRYISVVDCAMLLANEIYETGLEPQRCSLDNLRKKGVGPEITNLLQEMITDQGLLRSERNHRVHHGSERGFTNDDRTFRTAAVLDHYGNGVKGRGEDGRIINVDRSFKEGLVELQREFNSVNRQLVRRLDAFYDELYDEFHARFTPRFRKRKHPYGVGERSSD